MKFSLLVVTLLLAFICFVSPASATSANPIQQLLESRSCVACDLQNANLKGADLRGVNLSRANLRNADLRDAQLLAVNLKGADLRGANLTGADLLVVDFTDANLRGAKVDGVKPESLRFCHTIAEDGKRVDRDC